MYSIRNPKRNPRTSRENPRSNSWSSPGGESRETWRNAENAGKIPKNKTEIIPEISMEDASIPVPNGSNPKKSSFRKPSGILKRITGQIHERNPGRILLLRDYFFCLNPYDQHLNKLLFLEKTPVTLQTKGIITISTHEAMCFQMFCWCFLGHFDKKLKIKKKQKTECCWTNLSFFRKTLLKR